MDHGKVSITVDEIQKSEGLHREKDEKLVTEDLSNLSLLKYSKHGKK